MVHIANQWHENSPLAIRVFSNAEEVELFLNNKSLGRQKPDNNAISNHLKHAPITFNVSKFQAGKLEAKAYIKGKVVANHMVYTPEKPTQIQVIVDLSGYSLDDQNDDVVFVYAKILDRNKTLMTGFDGQVEFSFEGDVELIGENPVKAEAGIATILLRTKAKTKSLKIKVKTLNLDLKGDFSLKK
jgi:beta-galactosidase